MNAVAEAILGVAERRDDTFYETWGSNDGPILRDWEAFWGMRREPWCGIGLSALAREAGVWNEYGGRNFLSPSTAVMADNARRLGWVWNGVDPIPPGAVWINYGIHTELIVADVGETAGILATTGCNVSGGIYDRIRSTRGYVIVIPPAIKAPPKPEFETIYWLEDTAAKPYLIGQWRLKKNRDRVLEGLRKNPAFNDQHPRPQAHGPKTAPYQILGGGLRRYGPFVDKKHRTRAERILEKRIGHQLRPYATKRKVS